MSQTKRSYTAEFKKDSVKLALRSPSIAKTAKDSIFEYIEAFYNSKRLHSSIGYVSPMQFEMAA